jgi:hypothetical protein
LRESPRWLCAGVGLLLSACMLYESGSAPGTVPAACGAERSAADGEPCTCSADCRSESASCFDEATTGMPQGLCARKCTGDAGCDPGFVCASGYCFEGCLSSDDCGSGRSCQATETDEGVGEHGACTFLCDEPEDCTSHNCNVYRNMCLPEGKEPQGAGVGAPCARDADCKSDSCLGGACYTRCDPEYPRCPDDALCVEGLCLPQCTTDADCADYGVKSCFNLESDFFCF